MAPKYYGCRTSSRQNYLSTESNVASNVHYPKEQSNPMCPENIGALLNSTTDWLHQMDEGSRCGVQTSPPARPSHCIPDPSPSPLSPLPLAMWVMLPLILGLRPSSGRMFHRLHTCSNIYGSHGCDESDTQMQNCINTPNWTSSPCTPKYAHG